MDPTQFGKQIGALVRDLVEKGLSGLRAEIKALGERLEALPVPKDGKSVTVEELQPVVVDAVKAAVEALPKPLDGKSVDPEEVRALVATAVAEVPAPKSVTVEDVLPALREQVKAHLDQLPVPKDGESVTLDQALPPVLEAMRAAVAEIPPARDGESVSLASVVLAVMPSLREELQDAVEALPKPADGTSVTAAEVLPELRDQVAELLKALPAPKDGTSVTVDDVVEALLPRLERAVDAAMNKWALDFERRAQETLQRACAAIPKPKDGDDGRDALAVDAFDAHVEEDGRTVLLTLGAGDSRKEARVRFPVVLDCGVFKDGASYARGDAVTWAGSLWIAQKDAPEGKPDSSRDWRLSVKRGRDGKDAVVRTIEKPATVKVGG